MEWCAASAATATPWACQTSVVRPSSTPPTPATLWSTRLCGRAAQGGPAPGLRLRHGQQDHPVRRPHRARRNRRGVGTGQRHLRRGRRLRAGRKKLPSVQVGDPFMEKVLIECCLELYAAGLVIGIQDLGGAGLSCATSELASAGDGGMAIELDWVPLRATNMTPAEVLSSESQERMCAVVAPENVEKFMAVCRKWDVIATVIGEVTEGDRLRITWNGETVVDVPPRTVAHEGPVYQRPVARPDWQDELNADTSAHLPARPPARNCAPPCSRLSAARTCAAAPSSPSSTTGTCGATPCWPSTPTAACCGSTRPPDAASRSRPTPPGATPSSTLPRRTARPGRGLPQRRRHRRHPDRGDELPQLRFTGGSRRHVAVRPGGARTGGWLCGTWNPGHRRQCQLLQPDWVDRHPADPGRRCARGYRRCQPAAAHRFGR